MRTEATLKFFCSGLYSPKDILVAKTVLQRSLRWKRILHVKWGKIIQNLIEQSKASASANLVIPNQALCTTFLAIFLSMFPLLYFTLLYFTLLYFTLLYFTLLYFTLLYFTLLYFTLLYFTLPYHTLPHSPHLTSPHLTSPHLTSLHFTSLHFTLGP